MRAWPLVLLVGCGWVSDAELRERLDPDRDGVPFGVDCNDADDAVTVLVASSEVACGDVVTSEVGDVDLLRVSNCIHPLDAESLTHYSVAEDIRVLRSAETVEATVELSGGAGFVQTYGGDTGFDLGGVALFVWRGEACTREACDQGLPLPGRRGTWTSRVTGRLVPGEPWYVVVTAEPGSTYELAIACR